MGISKSSSEKVTGCPKHSSPVSPFPRHIWTHQATPPDSLDTLCNEIWKRVQRYYGGRKQKKEIVLLRTVNTITETRNTKERILHRNSKKDDIAHLVEQEYINFLIENISEGNSEQSTSSPKHLNDVKSIETFLKSVLLKKDPVGKAQTVERKNNDTPIHPGIRTHSMSTNHELESIRASKNTAHKLQTQLSTKPAETTKVTNQTIVVTRNCNTSVGFCYQTVTSHTESEINKKQLPVFCAKTEMRVPTLHHSGDVSPPSAVTLGTASIAPVSSVTAMPYSHMVNFPPLVPGGMNYGQIQQTTFQQTTRMTFAQAVHSQLRPNNQQLPAPRGFCVTFPQVNYISCIPPDYLYQQMNAPRPNSGTKGYTLMAGDGPQYFYHYPYDMNPSIIRPMLNRPCFPASGNSMKPF